MYNYKRLTEMPVLLALSVLAITIQSCKQEKNEVKEVAIIAEEPEYFLLRPELEKTYDYSHAVRIEDDLKISGAVSMDDIGVIFGLCDMEQQLKICYNDLEKILKHYGYTFDDVVVEDVYTTNMKEFINVSGFRISIYKKNPYGDLA